MTDAISAALATLDRWLDGDWLIGVLIVLLYDVVLVGCDFRRPGVRGVWRDSVRRRTP